MSDGSFKYMLIAIGIPSIPMINIVIDSPNDDEATKAAKDIVLQFLQTRYSIFTLYRIVDGEYIQIDRLRIEHTLPVVNSY